MTSETSRDAAVRAFLSLLEAGPFERIDMLQVAERAGVPLSELRVSFGAPRDLLAAFMRATDRQVLAAIGEDADTDGNEEPAQERLFEVLMCRLDALEPHRAAVGSLLASARRNPFLALTLLDLSVRSQTWMLAAAGLPSTGLAGATRARGLALLFGRILDVWLKDEDPGLARTMAALDRELANGAKLLGMLDDLAFLAMPWRLRRRSSAAPAAAEDEAAPVV